MRRSFLGFILLLVGCGGGSSGAATSPSASAICLPVAPMELQALEHGSEWEPMAILAADGTISQSVSKNSGVAFRIAADVLQDAGGTAKMSCDANRVLHLGASPLTMHFDSSDALVGDGGDHSRIFVSDAGQVEVNLGGKSQVMPWRITGVSAATRRTAEILVLAAMSSARWGG